MSEKNNGQREPAGAIWRRMPAMRKDEFERLALMLDNERGMTDSLCHYRNRLMARESAMDQENSRLKMALETILLKHALANEKITQLKAAALKDEGLWKRRVKAARRKALQDVCDVLNHRPKQR